MAESLVSTLRLIVPSESVNFTLLVELFSAMLADTLFDPSPVTLNCRFTDDSTDVSYCVRPLKSSSGGEALRPLMAC